VVKNGWNNLSRISGDSDAVVADADFDRPAEILRRRFRGRLEPGVASLFLALGGGVEAVAEQIETDAGHVLRHQFDRSDGRAKIAFQRDVELLVLRARTVIGEVERLFDQAVEVDLAALAAFPARMLEHAHDDAGGAPPVLGDFFQVAGQHCDDLVDIGTFVLGQAGDRRRRGLLQFVERFDGESGKIVDEVERE
jgi:hypothetical protein